MAHGHLMLTSNIYTDRQTQYPFELARSSPAALAGPIQQLRREAASARPEGNADSADVKVDHDAHNLQALQANLSPQNGEIAHSRNVVVKMDCFQPNRKEEPSSPKPILRHESS